MEILIKIEMNKVSLTSIAAETAKLFIYWNQHTFLDDKYCIPSATCQENFISCWEVKLVCGLISGSLK